MRSDFALACSSEENLAKPVKIFDRESTVRGVYLLFLTHSWEHLGQAIAYARVNGVVPPWTAEREARQKMNKEE